MDKREEKAALEHALDALSDGSGHASWGPGVVGLTLSTKSRRAFHAFDAASLAVTWAINGSVFAHIVTKENRVHFIDGMKKLAPVLLDIIQGNEDERAE